MNSTAYHMFTPESMVFQDDARHRAGFFSNVETWYYDAVFENGYSIVSLLNVIHIGRIGTVLSGIFIFRDGELIESIRKRYPLRKFYGSEKTPFLKINNQEVLNGRIENEKQWKYRIYRGDTKVGFDLEFIKTMASFKGRTYLGNWMVIPGFSVTGTLFLHGRKIPVKGEGYHDHNFYPIKTPFVTKGYFFGKIHLPQASVIWARVIKNKKNIETLVMLAQKDGYRSIHPKYMHFLINEEQKDHWKKMPYSCQIVIDDPQFQMDVSFQPKTYHYIGILAAHYWRYHEHYTGSYILNNMKEKIDIIDVAEYLKFF